MYSFFVSQSVLYTTEQYSAKSVSQGISASIDEGRPLVMKMKKSLLIVSAYLYVKTEVHILLLFAKSRLNISTLRNGRPLSSAKYLLTISAYKRERKTLSLFTRLWQKSVYY